MDKQSNNEQEGEPVDFEARSIVDIGDNKYSESFVVGDHIISHIMDWEGYMYGVESFRIKDVIRFTYIVSYNHLIMHMPESSGTTQELQVPILGLGGQPTNAKRRTYKTTITSHTIIITGKKVITDFLIKYYGCMDYELPKIFPGFAERQKTVDMLKKKQEDFEKQEKERREKVKGESGKLVDLKGNKMSK